MCLSTTAHQVFVGFVGETEVALIVDELLLFAGQFARLLFQYRNAALNFPKTHLGIADEVVDILQQSTLGGDNLLVEFHNLWVLLGLRKQLGSLQLRQ